MYQRVVIGNRKATRAWEVLSLFEDVRISDDGDGGLGIPYTHLAVAGGRWNEWLLHVVQTQNLKQGILPRARQGDGVWPAFEPWDRLDFNIFG